MATDTAHDGDEKVLGAPEADPDPSDAGFEVGRPRLGGRDVPIEFSDEQTAVLNAAADTMIPPGGGFPAPSEVDVVHFIARYVTPDDEEPIHYPFARESGFKAALDALGAGFASGDNSTRTAALQQVEKEDEDFFGQLRSLVYYGYYSRPAVTLAIQAHLPAGRDYHGPPQPYGYLRVIEDWHADEELFSARGGAGHIATEDVKRVDLSNIGWLKDR